ncbi:M20 family metallo-hydrolase [Marivirga harenae]|uniref:M20 family metallo-hydrolase n=1 Tax=Marivirga harenae TaxID=2010992 RepID=UPI0026DEFA47|nr:M20 family metallo-hydrolase [Marivirga harenae]WKV13926.1 M20 family metallo-hydrolase [Marivirga harenae]
MENTQLIDLKAKAIQLLKELITIDSFSKEEDKTADAIGHFLNSESVSFKRIGNNLIAYNFHFNEQKPSILLNSHHDTVKPNVSYTKNPFEAIEEGGKLYGLGSNDAGASLVSLIVTFLFFYPKDIPYNLIFIASAEEEISGQNGISRALEQIPICEVAIVGEPTEMKLAVAEKGLLVIDAVAKGKAGHAARDEGENAIYKAMEDILKVRDFKFKKSSKYLGENKVSATLIKAGQQHNVVPDVCEFTLDVRITDAYTLEEAFEELQSQLQSELKARSFRLQSSFLPEKHKIMEVAIVLGLERFGSPTLSDQALIPFDSVKIGPGKSERSHTADEFIEIKEIEEGIEIYIQLLERYMNHQNTTK